MRVGALCVAALLFLLAFSSEGVAAESTWLKSPKPQYPKAALNTFAEGSCTVRIVVDAQGHPLRSAIARSSGNRLFDQTAAQAAMKWRMNPKAVTQADMKTGRSLIFDFRQEAAVGAVYSDRRAYFSSGTPGIWTYAPFPEYPFNARRFHRQGTTRVAVQIGPGGKVASVRLVKSSGFADLDRSALTAVKLWRAKPEFAGREGVFPITFKMGR